MHPLSSGSGREGLLSDALPTAQQHPAFAPGGPAGTVWPTSPFHSWADETDGRAPGHSGKHGSLGGRVLRQTAGAGVSGRTGTKELGPRRPRARLTESENFRAATLWGSPRPTYLTGAPVGRHKGGALGRKVRCLGFLRIQFWPDCQALRKSSWCFLKRRSSCVYFCRQTALDPTRLLLFSTPASPLIASSSKAT